uniref:Uncharacterized protein n=1 Tax=Chromera velia CCMP2878 TaxID=1169474 RepID=A0A0G4GUE3_9ALVE|eukprot:Cvel_5219.t1-p1 / transcript=Cvel_5219.t1 / gene=Cvel_5219 / organism=Chromera_velia_CCMP2878 / gene_product=hypothetical protein / transcript_product=hypothetical protein / location=Cvel_scaffold240:73257-79357(-) / protein_length=977 / sequence_SO=supercontig / SO=protein_coding / is_pseudo=false
MPPKKGAQGGAKGTAKVMKADDGKAESLKVPTADEALAILLQQMPLTSETFSDLARNRESFSLAWLASHVIARTDRFADLPTSLDLSGTQGLTEDDIYFLINNVPSSIEEIKLDALAVKGNAYNLFLRFLTMRKLEATAQEEENGENRNTRSAALRRQMKEKRPNKETEVPIVTTFIFAENSFGPQENPECFSFFSLMLPYLERLILNDNPLGDVGIGGLGASLEKVPQKAFRLKELSLENVRLSPQGMASLKRGVEGRSLPVEKLSLSRNELPQAEVESFSDLLTDSSLPHLKSLLMSKCGLKDQQAKVIVQKIGTGGVKKLEVLDLGENECTGAFLSDTGKALKTKCVPQMRGLNLMGMSFVENKNPISQFLSALSSRECPPSLRVDMELKGKQMHPVRVRSLATGEYPPIRILSLDLENQTVSMFLRALVGTDGSPPPPQCCEVLDVDFHFGFEKNDEFDEGLQLLTKAIVLNRLIPVRKLRLQGSAWMGDEEETALAKAAQPQPKHELTKTVTAFTESLCLGNLPNMRDFAFGDFRLPESARFHLAAAFEAGRFSGLHSLSLGVDVGKGDAGEGFGKDGTDAVMEAIVSSEEGMPLLEELSIKDGKPEEGAGGSLGVALNSNKMPNVSKISIHGLTPEGMRGLGDAAREGGMARVSSLSLSEESGPSRNAARGETWMPFFEGIGESQDGLPMLKHLHLHESGPLHYDPYNRPTAAALFKLPALQSLSGEETTMCDGLTFRLDYDHIPEFADKVRHGQLLLHFTAPRPENPFLGGLPRGGIGIIPPRVGYQGQSVDSVIHAIAESENGLPPSIGYLNLSGGRVSIQALAALATSPVGVSRGKVANLERLDLRGCRMGDGHMRELGRVFSAHGPCRKMTKICLDRNRITAKGVSAFIKELPPQSFPRLEVLTLGDQESVKEDKKKEKSFDAAVKKIFDKAERDEKVGRHAWFGTYASGGSNSDIGEHLASESEDE